MCISGRSTSSSRHHESSGAVQIQGPDVLRVVDFYSSAPQFAFVRRAGVLLSVDTDKTDELELHTAVVNACSSLPQDVFVVDYTSRVDLCSHPGHYVVYWELSLPGGERRPVQGARDPAMIDIIVKSIRATQIPFEALNSLFRFGTSANMFPEGMAVAQANRAAIQQLKPRRGLDVALRSVALD
ncbi:probable indole-3-acetic acid-amido synthetase GH3.9 [Selaginella moellendorffii]|uniref:probable indole-3-acetic acid-amido synthetase GH3.9 n=1 Tax=Selaginella moellendorffii TaxID=88036 RepID=UPI000D1CEBB7|nr:probable indole-3-acetic acid-amido synthetase GH3.9 [Selaginella moellendorffii]|eukprot:XP_024532361.1 probable indole-3-acetic acid-amido synthetase GH3.9 [Selaginella moellendorffii]